MMEDEMTECDCECCKLKRKLVDVVWKRSANDGGGTAAVGRISVFD